MSKVTAPLLSFGASGQVAKTQVYSAWKGRPYVRRYVVPANPQSSEQTLTRNAFTFLQQVWKLSGADFQAPWDAYAAGQVLTGRNALTQKNIPILRPAASLDGMIMSPGAKGGLLATLGLVAIADGFTYTVTPPSPLPTGWTITKAVIAAILDQDPQAATDYEVHVATDATSPYTGNITGLGNTTDYAVAAWLIYQKSALATDLAYGPATAVIDTTGA